MKQEPSQPGPRRSAEEIQEWLVEYLAEELEVDAATIDVDLTFDRLGVGSLTAVVMSGAMETWLGRTVDPTAPYDHPTISQLAVFLAEPQEADTP